MTSLRSELAPQSFESCSQWAFYVERVMYALSRHLDALFDAVRFLFQEFILSELSFWFILLSVTKYDLACVTHF